MAIVKEILIRTGFLAYGCFGHLTIGPNVMAPSHVSTIMLCGSGFAISSGLVGVVFGYNRISSSLALLGIICQFSPLMYFALKDALEEKDLEVLKLKDDQFSPLMYPALKEDLEDLKLKEKED